MPSLNREKNNECFELLVYTQKEQLKKKKDRVKTILDNLDTH